MFRKAEADEKLKLIRQEPAIESVMKSVLKDVVSVVVSNVGEKRHTKAGMIDLTNQEHEKPSPFQRRGQEKRRQDSTSFKAEIINEMDNGEKAERLAIKYRINRSLALKWFKGCIKIMKATSSEHKKHLKIQPGRKYSTLCDYLLRVFKIARSKGYRLDFN